MILTEITHSGIEDEIALFWRPEVRITSEINPERDLLWMACTPSYYLRGAPTLKCPFNGPLFHYVLYINLTTN